MSIGLVALGATGCGGDSGSGGDGSGSGASGPNGKAGSSSTAASGPDLSFGGSSAPDPDDPINTCAGELIEAKYIPLDMYIMLDKSGSMLDLTDGDPAQTKWQAVSAALSEFVSDPESAGLGVGLQLFPLMHSDAPTSCTRDQQCGAFGPCFLGICNLDSGIRPCSNTADCGIIYGQCVPFGDCELPDQDGVTYICTPIGDPTVCGDQGACLARPSSECLKPDDCRAATYATPAAEIAELPGAEAGLLSVISATEPSGLTPTGPALQGALQQASSWAAAHPQHRVVAVLATDGQPTLYEQGEACVEIADTQTYVEQVDAVVQLAADALAASPSISTFAIGVMGPNDVDGPTIVNMIANAGGTNEAFLVDTQGDVGAQFREALNQIRGARLACELAIPEPEAGKTLDFNQVNVTFDNGGGPATLFYVEGMSGCDPTTGGWYYDKLPSAGTPERIVVCPTTCDQFGQVEMGSVQIQLGCATRTPVK